MCNLVISSRGKLVYEYFTLTLQIMSGEPLGHSGIWRIECLEDMGDAVWELDRASQTLRFTGLVNTIEGIGGLLVSSIIHHITLEMVLPLERMIMALNLNGNGEGLILLGLGDQGSAVAPSV
ncbi:hypothetical protein QL285_039665 [Trifolium repens]|nr:hypothetical protein QL285_039665 [Trifolium repens]